MGKTQISKSVAAFNKSRLSPPIDTLKELSYADFIESYNKQIDKHGKAVFEGISMHDQGYKDKNIMPPLENIHFKRSRLYYQLFGNGYYYNQKIDDNKERKLYKNIIIEGCGIHSSRMLQANFIDLVIDNSFFSNNTEAIDCSFENMQIINSPYFAMGLASPPLFKNCNFKKSSLINSTVVCFNDRLYNFPEGIYKDCTFDKDTKFCE